MFDVPTFPAVMVNMFTRKLNINFILYEHVGLKVVAKDYMAWLWYHSKAFSQDAFLFNESEKNRAVLIPNCSATGWRAVAH